MDKRTMAIDALNDPVVLDFINEGTSRPNQPKAKTTRSAKTPTERSEKRSPEFTRTIAKARIQKSIRFRPELIAEFEQLCRAAEAKGEAPVTIQQTMNESLAMWLASKKPKPKRKSDQPTGEAETS